MKRNICITLLYFVTRYYISSRVVSSSLPLRALVARLEVVHQLDHLELDAGAAGALAAELLPEILPGPHQRRAEPA